MSDIPEWAVEGLPEALHDVPFLKDAENLDAFKTRLSSAAEHVGNSMRIPGPDAAPEALEAFQAKLQEKVPGLMKVDLESDEGRAALLKNLGLPGEASEYGADEANGWLADAALKSQLTKTQFTALVATLGEVNKGKSDETAAERQVQIDALYNEWGMAKPTKLVNIEGLMSLTNAPADVIAAMKEGKMDAGTLKWLDGIADKYAQASNFNADRNEPDVLTPGEAHAQINEILNNPEYFKPSPIGEGLRKKMLALQKAANPQASRNANDLKADASFNELFGT